MRPEDPPRIAFPSGHDASAYRSIYARHRRLHIPNMLEPAAAEHLHGVLAARVPWSITLDDQTGLRDLSPEQATALKDSEWTELERVLQRAAGDRYRCLFESHEISENGEAYADSVQDLDELATFLNSAPVLEFFRCVTGHVSIQGVSARAIRWAPGHFSNPCDDRDESDDRLAAYVLDLTPDWQPEWGGVLSFIDASDGHVSEGYVPRFNALNIFDRGLARFTSSVTPAAAHACLSIAGWLIRG